MNYRMISGRDLDSGLVERWAEVQESDPAFASPYFRPEFAQCLAAVRRDVWIGLLESDRRVVGFFPFHRQRGGTARPLGFGLSDQHGVIVEPGVDWHVEDLMRGCCLVRWPFDHLIAEQFQWQAYHRRLMPSPFIDTSKGYAHYEAVRTELNAKQLKDAYRCMRKLEREIEGHRFTVQSQDPQAFEAAIQWKRRQCRETGVVDYFARPWTVELLRRLHALRSESFSGMLSTVHVGDTLIAVHLGMRSKKALHFWFPSYNGDYGKYSPGSILLVEIIQDACRSGIDYIDLGKGLAPYKERFMTGAAMVAEGCAKRKSIVNAVLDACERSEEWGGSSVLRPVVRLPARMVKRLERSRRYG